MNMRLLEEINLVVVIINKTNNMENKMKQKNSTESKYKKKKRKECGGKMIQTNKDSFESNMSGLLGSVWYKWECKKCGRFNESNFIMKTCCYKPITQ